MMNIQNVFTKSPKQIFAMAVITLLLAGCGGGSASSSTASGGAVTGVVTPSKVSVVNTN